MAEASSSSTIVPDFDPNSYDPLPHEFKPTGLKLHKLKTVVHDDDVVLREPDTHFSVYNREVRGYIRGHGGSGQVKRYYEALPQRAQELVQNSGFGDFVQLVGDTNNDRVQLTALAERWWDTTNSFHLGFGEATLTPLDFAAITGIRVGGDPIPFDMELHKNHAALVYFLGRLPNGISGNGTLPYSWFYEQFEKDRKAKRVYLEEKEFEQAARGFLFYLFGCTLFPNKDSKVHLHYLAGLRDFKTIKDYDWGGAALATLYGHMGVASRSKTPTMGGYWRVWEIWSYEFLGMFVPQNEYPDPMVIPRGLKWMRDSKGRKEGARDLVAYRAFLDQLQEDQVTQIVEWDVWAEIEEKASEDLLRSRVANGRRILLEGPFCREWYLGERVVRQSLGYGAFRVPKSIPQLSSRKLAKDDLIEWLEGHDAVAFLEEEGKDYGEYKTQWLMGPLGASSAESGRRQGLRARAMPTAVARGRGSEVQKRSRRAKLPKLPRRVSYTLDSGYVKCIDLPDPRSGMYCLPSNVEQVSREYAEACLRTIASLEVVIRRQAIAAHASALHVPQGTSLVRPVQGSRATSSTADQGIIVSSDGDDDEEETGSEEEDEEEDSKSGSSGSEPLGSEDTDNVTLSAMTRKTSKKYSRQDMTSRLPLKRQRKK